MAELPVELVHALMAHMADHASKINLALTSRSFYSSAMPLILAEEARYTRDVMIATGQLSLYESPNSRRRLPPSCLDSPNGLFTGTFRKISFTPWQLAMSMYCIRRIVRCAPHLECISMHVLGGSLRVWLAAYINICVERPSVEFVLNGGSGDVVITVDDEEPYYEVGLGPQPMGRRNLPFDHPLNRHVHHLAASTSSHTPVSPSPTGFGRLQQWKERLRRTAHSQSATSDGLIRPRISGLAITNEHLFSSRISSLVRMLVAGDHITSFTFSNIQAYPQYRHRKQGQQGVAGATSATATPNSHTQPRPSSRSHQSHSSHPSSTSSSTFTNSSNIPAILDSLTFPCLTHLALAHLNLPPRALMRFLARHPLITDLRLEVGWSDAGEYDVGTMSATTTAMAMAKMASTATHGVWGSDGMPMPSAPPNGRFLERLERVSGTPTCVGAFVRWRAMEKNGKGVGVDNGYLPALVSVQLLSSYPGEEPEPLECAAFGSVYDTLVGRGQAGPRVQGRGSDDILATASTSGRVSVSSSASPAPPPSPTSRNSHVTPSSPAPSLFLRRWIKHPTAPSMHELPSSPQSSSATTSTSTSASTRAPRSIRSLTLPPLASSWFLEWLARNAAEVRSQRQHDRGTEARWPVLPGIEELTISATTTTSTTTTTSSAHAAESSSGSGSEPLAASHPASTSSSSSSPSSSPSPSSSRSPKDAVAAAQDDDDDDHDARYLIREWAFGGVAPRTLETLLTEMGRCWPEVVREIWRGVTGPGGSGPGRPESEGEGKPNGDDDHTRELDEYLKELSRKMHDSDTVEVDGPSRVVQRVVESILWCTFPDLQVLQLQVGCGGVGAHCYSSNSDSDGNLRVGPGVVRIERPAWVATSSVMM